MDLRGGLRNVLLQVASNAKFLAVCNELGIVGVPGDDHFVVTGWDREVLAGHNSRLENAHKLKPSEVQKMILFTLTYKSFCENGEGWAKSFPTDCLERELLTTLLSGAVSNEAKQNQENIGGGEGVKGKEMMATLSKVDVKVMQKDDVLVKYLMELEAMLNSKKMLGRYLMSASGKDFDGGYLYENIDVGANQQFWAYLVTCLSKHHQQMIDEVVKAAKLDNIKECDITGRFAMSTLLKIYNTKLHTQGELDKLLRVKTNWISTLRNFSSLEDYIEAVTSLEAGLSRLDNPVEENEFKQLITGGLKLQNSWNSAVVGLLDRVEYEGMSSAEIFAYLRNKRNVMQQDALNRSIAVAQRSVEINMTQRSNNNRNTNNNNNNNNNNNSGNSNKTNYENRFTDAENAAYKSTKEKEKAVNKRRIDGKITEIAAAEERLAIWENHSRRINKPVNMISKIQDTIRDLKSGLSFGESRKKRRGISGDYIN
jgi:hypothetical protein